LNLTALFNAIRGSRTHAFVMGITKTFPAVVVAQILSGITTVLATRALGPSEFGRANLSLASTLWVQIPLFVGLPTALMHYTPQVEGNRRGELMTLGFGLCMVTGVVTLAVSFLFDGFWAARQGITTRVFDLGLAWCVGFWIYVMGTTMLSAREQFGLRGATEIVFAVFYPVVFFLYGKAHPWRGDDYVFSLAVAFAVSGVFALGPSLRLMANSKIDRRMISLLVGYGIIASFGATANALLNSPARLIANKYLTLGEVGILSVYQGGAGKISSLFLTVSANVFFPIASRTPDKKALFWRIHRAMVVTVLGLLILSWTLLWAYFKVAGSRYTIDFVSLGVYALGGVFTLFFGLVSWYLASTGRNGMIICVVNSVLAGSINFGLCLYLIPSLHILGAGVASVIASMVGIGVCYLPWVQEELSWLSTRSSIPAIIRPKTAGH
jgi:O-antigen/teichoic acid export membrane protein